VYALCLRIRCDCSVLSTNNALSIVLNAYFYMEIYTGCVRSIDSRRLAKEINEGVTSEEGDMTFEYVYPSYIKCSECIEFTQERKRVKKLPKL
jgi:hypothetical protein